jgi:uncharacterized protein (TIGR02270 family)
VSPYNRGTKVFWFFFSRKNYFPYFFPQDNGFMSMSVPEIALGEPDASYAEDAAFLWLQRAAAVRAPNVRLHQLAELDERLEAQIDGLRVAGPAGLQAADTAARQGGPEEIFVAAVLALEAEDAGFDTLLDMAHGKPELVPGLISALGWHEPARIGPRVQQLLRHENPLHRVLGVAACGVHRIDPGPRLAEALASLAGPVRARALRTAGELGLRQALPQIVQALGDRNRAARFWAAWSAVRLGARDAALTSLVGFATQPGERQLPALRLTLTVLEPEAGHALLQQIPPSPDTLRLQIIGAGLTGAPRYIPWLIEQMRAAPLARIAADAFVLITGADFNIEQMETPPPEGFGDGPTDDPDDEDVVVPEDVALPWPDATRITAWWTAHAASFAGSTRFFMGAPVTGSHCRHILNTGFQTQRRLAALHLAVSETHAKLFNVSARASQQIEAN